MSGIIERISIRWRERRFRRSLEPGAIGARLRVAFYAAAHGARGPEAAEQPAAIEDVVDAWGMNTVGERHSLIAGRAGKVLAELEACRFGEAEKGYSNILQRYAAKVKKTLANTEGLLRDAKVRFTAAAKELARHCAEIAAPLSMLYRERTDGLWKAFAAAISIEALAGAVSTADELGWALSMILAGILGAVVFFLGCGAGWARQHAWVARRTGWAMVIGNFAIVTLVLLAFCSYRLSLAALAAATVGISGPAAAATAATVPPLVLLLAIAGWIAWFWTMHVWIGIFGAAPGVRVRAIKRKRAAATCHDVVGRGRKAILDDAATADAEVDRGYADAAFRRAAAPKRAMEACAEASIYDREREAIFGVWGAAHAEFAGIVTTLTDVQRAPRALPNDYPIIPVEHVPGTVAEIQTDADALMLDEGRAKLAIAATCTAGLRDLDRLTATLPDAAPRKDLLP